VHFLHLVNLHHCLSGNSYLPVFEAEGNRLGLPLADSAARDQTWYYPAGISLHVLQTRIQLLGRDLCDLPDTALLIPLPVVLQALLWESLPAHALYLGGASIPL